LDSEGATPLFCAAKNLHIKTIKLLVEKGADPNVRRPDGQTALSTAVGHIWDEGGSTNNNKQVAELLLENGARLDAIWNPEN
jgi:ankyrin repeat protein